MWRSESNLVVLNRLDRLIKIIENCHISKCTADLKKKKRKKKETRLFISIQIIVQNETGTNHHGLLSTSV